MRTIGICSLALLLILSFDAVGETAHIRTIGLDECIDLALRNDLELQIVRRGPEIAHRNLNASLGSQYDPLFTFEAKREYWDVPGNFNNAKLNNDNPYQQTLDIYRIGLSGRLAPGLSYDFSASSTKDAAFTDFAALSLGNRRTNNYEAIASLNLRQSLLKDFWVDAGRMVIQVNKKSLKMSQQALRLQVMKTVLAVQVAYCDLVYAAENKRLAEKGLVVAQGTLEGQRKAMEIQQISALDVKLSEAQVEAAVINLLSAENILDTKLRALRTLIANDSGNEKDVVLEPVALPRITWAPPNREESLKKAMMQRPELALAKLEVEKQGVVVKYRYNQLFPALDLEGSYGGLAVEHESRGETFDSLSQFDHAVYSAGIILKIPLSNTEARNNYKASRQYKEQALLQLKKTEQEIFAQVDDSVKSVENTYKRFSAAGRMREIADATLSGELKMLANEKTNPLTVSEYERRAAEAKAAEILALVDHHKALGLLSFNEGTILEKYRITLDIR
jgi:outer membrane protein TolC